MPSLSVKFLYCTVMNITLLTMPGLILADDPPYTTQPSNTTVTGNDSTTTPIQPTASLPINNTVMGSFIILPTDLHWTAAPAVLPIGAQMTILEGDPSKSGPFTIRLKLPANYKIPPHMNLGDDHITVISGSYSIGMGDKFDTTKGKDMPAGAFISIRTGDHSYSWTADDTILQLQGVGPWNIQYVHPSDDPRKQ